MSQLLFEGSWSCFSGWTLFILRGISVVFINQQRAVEELDLLLHLTDHLTFSGFLVSSVACVSVCAVVLSFFFLYSSVSGDVCCDRKLSLADNRTNFKLPDAHRSRLDVVVYQSIHVEPVPLG
ncbi:hypothetical protein AMECASPLE_017655 [Ameca splendens]|uniref:Uncharacterized protein n=1 Tax=Ameca splendens TaxID=208324 RepID=A0ABV1A8Y9_9TELE